MLKTLVLVLALIPIGLAVEVQARDRQASPEEVFDSLWETFDRRYALFEAKSVDWQALHDVYRPRVSPRTTDEVLFRTLTGMLSHLNDTHVMLQATSLGRDYTAGNLQPYFEDGGLAGALALLRRHPLPPRYFRSAPDTAGHGVFQYGWVGERIGYVHILGFEDARAEAARTPPVGKPGR